MKYKYEAYSPADNGEYIARDEVELGDMSNEDLTTALVNEVESKELVDAGSQIRVNVWRDGEEAPFLSHSWDHS
jgi:carbamoylphosphate synthase large subunit